MLPVLVHYLPMNSNVWHGTCVEPTNCQSLDIGIKTNNTLQKFKRKFYDHRSKGLMNQVKNLRLRGLLVDTP